MDAEVPDISGFKDVFKVYRSPPFMTTLVKPILDI